VNPNSPEGRVEASIAAKNEPDMQRDPNTGRLDPTRSARNLDRDATAAGNAAFDASVSTDLGIENASGMNRSELDRQTRDVVTQRTLDMDHKLRGDDIRTHGQMPAGAVDSNTQAAKQAAARRRAKQDNDDLADSQALGSGQMTAALRNLSSKYATMQTGPQPGYVEPASAPAPAAQPKRANQANTPTDFADPNRPMQTAPKPAGSTPSASFADAVNGVRQFWKTSPPRPSPNIPQDPNAGRNDVNNFNGIPKPVRREVIPARNPRSTNSMRDFDLYGPLK
jgi:hypothetical protein